MPSKSKSKSPYKFSYTDAIQGKELYNYFGNRVLESRASSGRVVAVKVKPTEGFARSEADMMHYASQQPGILAPQVLGCYDVDPEITVTVSDLVEGDSLDNVWHTMTKEEQKSIKEQLKEQLRLFRQCTQPYIGRINRQETKNFYDRIHFHFMGPFESEEEFDSWGLERVKSPIAKKIWARLLPGMRGTGEQKFVLTHGDLAARNIMVKDGKITGIVDWEYSGVFPEYMEYALATVIHDCHEDWWKPHLKEILEPCGFKRARFTAAIKWRGW
ncbi:kinase-like domain-containing protein [Aspergillus transmontanensis]|uniref:non-specific serine/threonine protein kinase n=1 Tax=Aspergillus transmontanensis TaxID=1034304 RepID=A0A5N6VMF9_9EURO|nr:kinase-like domain-containing protein [Aspergillus transmontanensis]